MLWNLIIVIVHCIMRAAKTDPWKRGTTRWNGRTSSSFNHRYLKTGTGLSVIIMTLNLFSFVLVIPTSHNIISPTNTIKKLENKSEQEPFCQETRIKFQKKDNDAFQRDTLFFLLFPGSERWATRRVSKWSQFIISKFNNTFSWWKVSHFATFMGWKVFEGEWEIEIHLSFLGGKKKI